MILHGEHELKFTHASKLTKCDGLFYIILASDAVYYACGTLYIDKCVCPPLLRLRHHPL